MLNKRGRGARSIVRWFVGLAGTLAIAACSAPAGEADASVDVRADLISNDAAAIDAIDAPIDARDVAPMDSVEAAVDVLPDDVVIDYGMCGMPVRACLCGCGMDATCQGGCINGDVDCGACFYGAAMVCCPAEESAFSTCIDRYMCADQACVTTHCAAEEAAFNLCFQRRQTAVPACTEQVRACLGSDYPMVRCAMP